jgi:hypothetical protein
MLPMPRSVISLMRIDNADESRAIEAERELAELEADRSTPKPAKVLPAIADAYRAMVNELETVLSPVGLERGTVSDNDIVRARAQLRDYLGDIVVTETESEIRLQTEASTEEMVLRLAGNGSQVFMVAGASFVCRFRPIELRKDHSRYPKCSKRHGCEQA